ncbi:DoxX family protein [Aquimarina algicola]|uniref:Methylamine utilisation protein MauE domain-containing protein n=1 Tax=Aquimarina algicola TaxID=2589995 RepID=A0A504JH15_9FLAO|nr:MauE/DoxX family redox-associated membrane protein [Aquimarina algicola]TPN87705.1 hypothetical protein FHK87_09005 [Aquimarina algicola]
MIKFLIYSQACFYCIAGINHFLHPEFYLDLIPNYLFYPRQINWISGLLEIILAILFCIHKTRKIASIGIIIMLVGFIPSHIYFIQIGSCIEGGLCTQPWVAWVRLLLIHPLFLIWAWYSGGLKLKIS